MGTGFIQQRLRHLGLYSLFAEVFYLTTMRTPEELRKQKEVKDVFEVLCSFLKSAELGLRIEDRRTQFGVAGIVSNLNEVIKSETAYLTIRTFLPNKESEAEELKSLLVACQCVLRGKATKKEIEELRIFAKKVVSCLEREGER